MTLFVSLTIVGVAPRLHMDCRISMGIALLQNVKNRKLRTIIQLCSDGPLNGIIYGDCLM